MSLPLPLAVAALFGVGFVAGTLNVLAGGGSLLTLPLLIFLGLPPTVANGTNRVAILAQNVAATWSFRRHGILEGGWLRLALPPALVGAGVGTWLATEVSDAAFQRVLSVLMVVVALWTLFSPVKPRTDVETRPPEGAGARGLLVLAFFGVGVYGGFIQAGLGFVILALVTGAGLDLVRGNALKVALVLGFTPLALAGFAWKGMVDWGLGAALAAGTLTGALLGVRLNVTKGQGWVKRVVTAAILVFALRLWLSA